MTRMLLQPRGFGLLLSLFTLCLMPAAASAWDASLAEERFTENGFGISLRPPASGELDVLPTDGSLAAWRLGERAAVRFRIDRQPEAFDDLLVVANQTWGVSMFGLTLGKPTFVHPVSTQIAGRPALIQTAEIQPEAPAYLPEAERRRFDVRPRFFAQAAMKLDPFSVAYLELVTPAEDADRASRLLDAIVASVSVAEPTELYRLRREKFEAARDFLAGFDARAAAEAQPGDAWFELTGRGGTPLGFARSRWWTDPDRVRDLRFTLRDDGFAHGFYTQVDRGPVRLITRHDAYVTDEGDNEVWSNVSEVSDAPAQRGLGMQAGQRAQWSETGLRDEWDISLAFKSPPSVATVREVLRAERQRAAAGVGAMVEEDVLFSRTEGFLEIPDRLPPSLIDGVDAVPPSAVYVDQVVLPLLPEALIRAQPGAYAFYAYDPESGTLAMRTYQVERTNAGGAEVSERPTPWSPATLRRFDARGRLVEVLKPGGIRMTPTTRDALARTWAELR